METFKMIVELLGGLALFLYGMDVMGDGLKSSSAGALKRILEKVTSNPVKSFFLGFFITAVIQSSTATIVLVVGLIGAGVLTLKQSVGIVMGANVGTTVTAHIIRLMDVNSAGASFIELFKPETLAPIAAVIGIMFIMFIKKAQSKNIGQIAIGFGILFTGLINMTGAMSAIDTETLSAIIIKYSTNPFFGLVIGMVVTFIIQSSSASVGVLQSLALTGAIVFNFSYAYILGAALGTCITTAIVCSIGTKEDAKRVGIIHIIFNVVGTILFMSGLSIAKGAGAFPELWNKVVAAGDIANFETIFKLTTAVILLPFVALLIKISKRIIKDKPAEENDDDIAANLKELNQQLLTTPVLALAQVKHLLTHMCDLAIKNYNDAVKLLGNYNEAKIARMAEREALIDKMADATNNYLITLSPKIESDADNKTLRFLLQTLTEFERIGDLAQNLAETAQKMNAEGQEFSQDALNELTIMTDSVREALELSYEAFVDLDQKVASKIEPLEEVIDDLNELLRERHIERLKAGKCTVTGGIFFFDLVINLERIGDQCSDVAVFILGLKHEEIIGNEHQYIKDIHDEHDAEYEKLFERNTKNYIEKLKMLPVISK